MIPSQIQNPLDRSASGKSELRIIPFCSLRLLVRFALIPAAGFALFAAGCGKAPTEAKTPDATPNPPQSAAGGSGLPDTAEFCYEIRYGDDVDKIKSLLDRGMPPNGHDHSGLTPLVCALMQGSAGSEEARAKIVKLLLDHKADINADGSAALYTAIVFDSLEIVRTLIENGANINAVDKDGLTPLMCAARNSKVEAATLLLEKGASPDAKAANGNNAWAIAFDYAYGAPSEDHLKMEKLLRHETNRGDIEALLTKNHPDIDVKKWLRNNP